MQYVHNYLCARHPWYAAWHRDTHANAVAWAVLFFITVLYAQALSSAVGGVALAVMPVAQSAAVISVAEKPAPEPAAPAQSDTGTMLGTLNSTALSLAMTYDAATGDEALKLAGTLEVRRNTLNGVAESDPGTARVYIFTGETRETIPEPFLGLVEAPIDTTGIYRAEGSVRYIDTDDGRSYVLALTDEESALLSSGIRVDVGGVLLTNGVVVPTSFAFADAQ